MQSGKLNYAYRLSAARVAILRLRFARRRQRLSHCSHSPSRASARRALATLAMVGLISCSAWLGYRAGQLTVANSTRSTDPRSVIENTQHAEQKSSVILAVEQPLFPGTVAAAVHEVPFASVTEDTARQIEQARLYELSSLRNTVDELEAQVQALELETSDLELELLDQQMDFAKTEEHLKEASVERRVVYNFTNVPLGGFVSEERIESDAQQAEFVAPGNDFGDQTESIEYDTESYGQYNDAEGPVDEAGGRPAGRFSSVEPAPQAGSTTGSRIDPEVSYGPPADRFNDWVNE